jgi:hypothetical protein
MIFHILGQGMSDQFLSVDDHRRDEAGLVYVYPVVSRRAARPPRDSPSLLPCP